MVKNQVNQENQGNKLVFSSIAKVNLNSSNLSRYEGKNINVENAYPVETRYGTKLVVEGNVDGRQVSLMLGKTGISYLYEQGVEDNEQMVGMTFKIGSVTIMGKKTVILDVVKQGEL